MTRPPRTKRADPATTGAMHPERWQGSGPRVMSHRPLPDCRVKGAHYCHSRYKAGA